jgi:hypothetical protein
MPDVQEFQSNAGYTPSHPQVAVTGRLPTRSVYISRAEASSNWRIRRRPRVAAEGWNMITEHLARVDLENSRTGPFRARQTINVASVHELTRHRRIISPETLGEEDTIVWDPRH